MIRQDIHVEKKTVEGIFCHCLQWEWKHLRMTVNYIKDNKSISDRTGIQRKFILYFRETKNHFLGSQEHTCEKEMENWFTSSCTPLLLLTGSNWQRCSLVIQSPSALLSKSLPNLRVWYPGADTHSCWTPSSPCWSGLSSIQNGGWRNLSSRRLHKAPVTAAHRDLVGNPAGV